VDEMIYKATVTVAVALLLWFNKQGTQHTFFNATVDLQLFNSQKHLFYLVCLPVPTENQVASERFSGEVLPSPTESARLSANC
jgi:hypothetical protein